jgi:hypothetical protein
MQSELSNDFWAGLRTEWAKAKARATCWSEEVSLVREEMRRVLCFIQRKRNWWLDNSKLRTDARSDVQEGLLAYGSKQAAILTQMGRRFADEWYPILARSGMSAEWPEEYLRGQGRYVVEEERAQTVVQDDEELEIEDDWFD